MAWFVCFIGVILWKIAESANVWIPYNNNIQYQYVTECRSWSDSQSYCTRIGGELASASTVNQRNFIVNTVYDGTKPSGSCTTWPGSSKGVYLGGTTNKQDTVNWFDGTSTSFNQFDWDTSENEPDHLNSHTIIGFDISSREWHTVYPGDRNAQICQKYITLNPTVIPTHSPSLIPTGLFFSLFIYYVFVHRYVFLYVYIYRNTNHFTDYNTNHEPFLSSNQWSNL